GPFEVVEVVSPTVFRLRMGQSYPGGPTFNLEHLRPYVESPKRFGLRSTKPESDLRADTTEEVEVDRIIAHKPVGRGYQFFVHYKDLPDSEDEWRSAKQLTNAAELVREYRAAH
ncbi:hypothetical protein CYLTODRAFT_317536, partial [Cylindrobasidium torrendii FP15055 ss-10]